MLQIDECKLLEDKYVFTGVKILQIKYTVNLRIQNLL